MRQILPFIAGALLLLCWFGCEDTSRSSIDSSFSPPILLQASISVSAINTDTINVGATRKPEDLLPITLTVAATLSPDAARPPLSVQVRVTNPNDYSTLSTANMLDDGSAGDLVKGDGLYTARPTFQIQRVQIGNFNVEVVATGINGYRSNTILLPLTIFRGNHAPTVTLVEGADSVQLRNESQLLILRLKVSDEDGIADISRVIFNSFRPDGSPSGGNPFQMHDDGSAIHADEKAGDGIFSLLVELPSITPPGTYRFEFQALDRSNAVSNLLVHRITVKP